MLSHQTHPAKSGFSEFSDPELTDYFPQLKVEQMEAAAAQQRVSHVAQSHHSGQMSGEYLEIISLECIALYLYISSIVVTECRCSDLKDQIRVLHICCRAIFTRSTVLEVGPRRRVAVARCRLQMDAQMDFGLLTCEVGPHRPRLEGC